MSKYIAGIIAGFVATVVLSLLMIMKGKMGVMPDFDVISMIATQMNNQHAMAWIAHITLGSVGYGILMAVVSSNVFVHANRVLVGVGIGISGWLMMMVAVMPMMGQSVFGLSMPSGMMIPVAALMLHVIFGAVLGSVYAKLTRPL